jgi:hypothetical protein
MATTIRSTELDFFEIKESLKLFLKQQEEFRDYDFEGSGLSNILDVLAHNTHFNGLIANFALNESYLTTAQLRNSVVSLAESLGYIPRSISSAQCTIALSLNLGSNSGFEDNYSLLPGELVLRGSIDDNDFTFTNRETLYAQSNGTGTYDFAPFENSTSAVTVFEGQERQEEYVVDGSDNAIYIIPDNNIDTSTTIIKLFEDQSLVASGSGAYKVYNNLFDAITVDESSRLYVLRESPNKYYELTFGANNSLGETPSAGNVVQVNYLRSAGTDANGVASLRLGSSIYFKKTDGTLTDVSDQVNVTVITRATGGDSREDKEEIRKRAPYQYAAQNRMITSLDYEALILRKYAGYISDIICWGGQEDYRKDYGSVYSAIVWKPNLSSLTVGMLRDEIRELVKSFSTVSFQIKFEAPSETWLTTNVYYQYNPTLSAKTESTINSEVSGVVEHYFGANTGKFRQAFRRSNLLTEIDESDPAILSSRAEVGMEKRIVPVLTISGNHELQFPAALKEPTDVESPVVRSSMFSSGGKTVYIRNKLTDRVKVSPEGRVPIVFDRLPSTKLEIVDADGNVVVSNTGSYDPVRGIVTILGLTVDSVLNANNYIKIFATPANESAIIAEFNNVIKYDDNESNVYAVTVTSRN